MLNKIRESIEKNKEKNVFWRNLKKGKNLMGVVFKGKSFGPSKKKQIKFCKRFIKENDLVFDVGANHGLKTNLFLNCGAKVIAIEPQKKCIERLKKKYKKNKNVIIVGRGLSSKEERKTMFISDSDAISTFTDKWTSGRFTNCAKWDGREEVELITIESLIQKHGLPNYCKIDVEGFELEVIKGLISKIPLISFEFTEEFFDDTIKIINKLYKKGYKKFNYVEKSNLNFENKIWLSKDEFILDLKDKINPKRKEFWGDIYAR